MLKSITTVSSLSFHRKYRHADAHQTLGAKVRRSGSVPLPSLSVSSQSCLSLHASSRRPAPPPASSRLHGSPLQQVRPRIHPPSRFRCSDYPYFSVTLHAVFCDFVSNFRENIDPSCWCWVNRTGKESLKAGDHIYSWRAAWVYAHHGAETFICPCLSLFSLKYDWIGLIRLVWIY
jgi:hypothetical protein